MMKSFFNQTIVLIAIFLSGSIAVAQIPVELLGGHKKSTIDIMFFKFFKNKSGENSPFLFFNRNRASVDYTMTTTSNLPQFGFTEAISYNHKKLRGFAPVAVLQVFNSGVFAKGGIQFAYIRKHLTLFSWLVCEAKNNPSVDLFFLGRFTPELTEKLNLFSQLEILNTAPTSGQNNFSFTQRIRLGLKMREFQFGAGADFNETGRTYFIFSNNIGGFLRYEF